MPRESLTTVRRAPRTMFMVLSVLLAGCGHIPIDGLPDKPARQVNSPTPRESGIVRDFRFWLSQLAEKNQFSGAVLWAKGDKILFQHAYGFADRPAGIPNKVDS